MIFSVNSMSLEIVPCHCMCIDLILLNLHMLLYVMNILYVYFFFLLINLEIVSLYSLLHRIFKLISFYMPFGRYAEFLVFLKKIYSLYS